ncbi:MAG: (d)CMP kinase [Chitinophagaceae bacterium]|nr:(d)CMP kinase [Chitinophagaceae bacterium]
MDSSSIIIAVDGFSSCGKSTMAKQLSKILNYVFVDSGAMYRAITLYFMQHEIAINDPQMVVRALENIQLAFKINPESSANEIYLNGENVESKIRSLAIAERVSDIAAISAVRSFAVKQQQQMGINGGIVMDGRDIGTVVFPQADLKIFMTADLEIRVERRFKELALQNKDITKEEVRENLAMRDHIDSNRADSPLKMAEDARVLDNSYLHQDEQLELALRWAYEKINLKNLF